MVTSVDDILEDMQPRVSAYLNDNKNRLSETQQAGVPEMKSWVSGDRGTGDQSKELSTEEKIIFDHITDRPVHIDELTHHCGPTVPVMSVLLQLELKHLVKQLPGKLFVNESTT